MYQQFSGHNIKQILAAIHSPLATFCKEAINTLDAISYLRQKLGRPGVNSADFCGLENLVVY